jgi:hypothetical protein
MEITDSVFGGFLPPNVNRPEGEGFVLFSINSKKGIVDNTAIENKADIYFDFNEPVLTPFWKNTIDISPPLSSVSPLPPVINDTIFTVKWIGSDDKSGIGSFRIFYSENSDPFKVWLFNTTKDSALFYGKIGKQYSFYSIAIDQLGNVELPKTSADAQTQIVVSTEPEKITNTEVWLKQNNPNPFSGKSIIEYYLPNKMEANLTITDMMGRKEIVLAQGSFETGTYVFELTSSGFNKGVYFIKLRTTEGTLSKKVIIQ